VGLLSTACVYFINAVLVRQRLRIIPFSLGCDAVYPIDNNTVTGLSCIAANCVKIN
jgi:hypothetical protein